MNIIYLFKILTNVLVNVKENGFDGKKMVAKLCKIKRLQNKE